MSLYIGNSKVTGVQGVNMKPRWGEILGNLEDQVDLEEALDSKQDTLISGTTIKTINGNDILGEGDIEISGVASWGSINGTLSNQIDLKNALDNKQDYLISGVNIKTINGNNILGEGNISVGGSSTWGSIGGTLSNQTDLKNALDSKQGTLSSGVNIKTINGASILGSGNLSVTASSMAWGNLTGSISNQTDLQSALNGKQDFNSTIIVLATSGTVSLTSNMVHTITPSATVTFSLPSISDNTKFYQILVQINMTTARTLNLGTTYFFNKITPSISSAGVYNLYYEYDKAKGWWVCGVMPKGVIA